MNAVLSILEKLEAVLAILRGTGPDSEDGL